MASDEEDRLNERLERMEAKIDHVRELMDGGMNPAAGMIIRIDRLEQHHLAADRQRGQMVAALIAMAVAIVGALAAAAFGIWFHFK